MYVYRTEEKGFVVLLGEEKEKVAVVFGPIFQDHQMGAPCCAPGED